MLQPLQSRSVSSLNDKVMNVLQFKTNINCQNCVRAVSGFLNEVSKIREWKVETDDPDKILTVEGDEVTIAEIVEAVEDAGFDIELLIH